MRVPTEDIISRVYADDFSLLRTKASVEELIETLERMDGRLKEKAQGVIVLSYGIYCVSDTTVSIAQMLAFAMEVKKSLKSSSDKSIGIFDKVLHQRNLKEIEMFALFQSAIDSRAFLAYYQPKVDAITTKSLGRRPWCGGNKKMAPFFFPIISVSYLRNIGRFADWIFYVKLSLYVAKKAVGDRGQNGAHFCELFPCTSFGDHLVSWINDVVEQNQVTEYLIEIEWTETVIMNDNGQTVKN